MKFHKRIKPELKAVLRENKQPREKRRDERTNTLYGFCMLNNIFIDDKSLYHFRLSKTGFPDVDVFPTSSKIHVLDKGKKGKYVTVDIHKWLREFYNVK